MILEENRREVMQKIVDRANIDGLLAIINRLDEQTRAEVLTAISKKLNIQAKNFHLNKIRQIIKAHDDEIKDWIVTAVAESYSGGANMMYADLKKLSVKPEATQVIVAAWTADKIRQVALLSVQKDAVNALVSDVYLDFANSMNGLVRGVEHQLNETMKRQIRAQMIAGQITGSSMRDIAKEVREIIGSQGFSVLTDKGGNSWTLPRYSEMLARTHIIKSANEGAEARMIEFGVDLYQLSTHPGACAICKPHEGKVFSLSGDSETYPKRSFDWPIHPRCRHTLLPRPELQPIEE